MTVSCRGMFCRSARGAALLLVLFALVMLAQPAAAAKKYPPLGRVVVLMAQERLSQRTFESYEERKQAGVAEATRILERWQQRADAAKAKGRMTPFVHDVLKQRYAMALSEVPQRTHRMLRPGGLAAALKRFRGWVKRTLKQAVAVPVRILIRDREFADMIAELVVTAAEWKTTAGLKMTTIIEEVESTERGVRDAVRRFRQLGQLFRRQPRIDPVSRAVAEREKCVYACDNVRADCARRNCRMHKDDENCDKTCAGCEPRVCEQAFSPAWAAVDREYIPCSGRWVASYLTELQNCVNDYIKDKSNNRFLNQADCYADVNRQIVPERDECRDQACATKCAGDYAIVIGQCLCLARDTVNGATAGSPTQ